MGTSSGTLKIFHAPTLAIKFIHALKTKRTENQAILNIVHMEEIRTVLVSGLGGEVWFFFDTVTEDGLRLQFKVDSSPCFHFVKVNREGRRREEERVREGREGGRGREKRGYQL